MLQSVQYLKKENIKLAGELVDVRQELRDVNGELNARIVEMEN